MKKVFAVLIIIVFSLMALTIVISITTTMNARKIKLKSDIENQNIHIEILDATGEKSDSVLKYITELFERLNFDVVYSGKASDTIAVTYIVERLDEENLSNARAVAQVLKINRLYFHLDHDSIVNVTLILGKDSKKLIKKLEAIYGLKRKS